MEQIHVSLNILREHLNTLKVNLPDDINKEIANLENRYMSIMKTNNETITDTENNVEYWLYTTYLNTSILLQNLKFKCFITNNIIKSNYSNFFLFNNIPIFYYYFENNENSFILLSGGSYNLPIAIYYLEKDIYYRLIYSNPGSEYNQVDKIIENMKITEDFVNCKYKIINNYKRLNIAFCFFLLQAGHYIWNEISGIYPLILTKLIKTIDILVVGNWDVYNMCDIILNENISCKIIKYNDFINENNNYNAFYFKIGEGFVLEETKNLIINNIKPYKKFTKKVLYFSLKLDRRVLENITEIYVYIINNLIKDNIINNENTIILFDGYFKNNSNLNYYNTYSYLYLDAVEYITKKMDDNIEYISLIGMETCEGIKYYDSIDYFIGAEGSNMDLIKLIYKKKGCLYSSELFRFVFTQTQYFFENVHEYNKIYGQHTHSDLSSNYIIDKDLLYQEIKNNIYK
jgi:hypothetical protein